MVVQLILASRTVTRNKKSSNENQTNVTAEGEQPSGSTEEAKASEDAKTEEDAEQANGDDETATKEEKPKAEEADKSTAENDDDDKNEEVEEVEEYYVKYRNFSYLHCEWKTEEELFKGDKRIAAKLKRFKQKMAHNTNIFENVG